MTVQRVGLKLFLSGGGDFPQRELIPVFHRWIREQRVPDHLLIDVHDYSHVFRGPGILLVAHEGNFSLDWSEDRPGLLYYRKRPAGKGNRIPLKALVEATLRACLLLEREETFDGALRFKTDEFLVSFNDRLLAPNAEDGKRSLGPVVEEFFHGLLPNGFSMEAEGEPRERLSLRVRSEVSASLEDLLRRVPEPR
jgi:hypothetical protein